MKLILIIEDDEIIRTELAIVLRNNGYKSAVITNYTDILDQINLLKPDLILLDIGLPGTNGFDICTHIRAESSVPIIFVTSRNTDMDELRSITLGGDDFITKPYNIPILLARISALLKRSYPIENREILAYKDVHLCLDTCKIEYRSMNIELTLNELKILSFLFKNNGKIVPRTDLIEYLWDNQCYIDDNTLSVNITRIRGKLEQIGLREFIKTKYKQGYSI